MKNSIYKLIALTAVAAGMSACDDNAWNDKLDGFDGNPAITDVKTIEYTLTDADYASISSNATNEALAGEENAAALKAVGTQHYFTEKISAADYVPAFLNSNAFPYFTLSDGSSIKLTYNVSVGLPEEITQLAAADKYTITTEEYQRIWGSDDNFINGFAPSKSTAKYIPQILSDYYDDAVAGDYVIVTYQMSAQEPVFGNVSGGGQEEVNYTHVKAGEVVSDNTYVVVSDGNAATTVAQDKNYGYLPKTEVEEDGIGLVLTDAESACEFTFASVSGGYNIIDSYGRYLYMTGTYNSFNFATELPEEGAVWTVEIQDDGLVNITNVAMNKSIQYDPNYSSYGSYPNEQGVKPVLYVKNTKAKAIAKAPVAEVPMTTTIAVWGFNGSAWTSPSDVVILQPSDYTAMGQAYQNLSNNTPAELLPIFLKNKYPFAQAEDSKFVMYQYYSNSVTNYVCDQYVYDGTNWVKSNGVEKETNQFVKNNGVWNYDPSVTITLPAGKGIEISTKYFQACVDWVYENIDVPLGSTSIKSGLFYVTSYGNNEYYSGTSAYQGNVDLRASKAIEQYPEGYQGMSNDEIVELMKTRFAYEVMPGALKTLHPDAKPVPGIDVIYTINFGIYTGTNATHTIRYQVTGEGEFTFLDCDWWEGGKPQE